MYEVKRSEQTIGDIKVDTWCATIESSNVIGVEVGTTWHKGGDAGHGARTYLKIEDYGGTDIHVTSLGNSFSDNGFSVVLGGDSEIDTLISALEFAVRVLKEQRGSK